MSYLHLPSLNMADISKGTISLWFRFSQDSVDKAKAYYTNWTWQEHVFHPEAPYIFQGTIPLVTFGRKVMAHVYDNKSVQVGTAPAGAPVPEGPIMASQVDNMGDARCEPSHIGIDCSGEHPTLVMHFQTDTRAFVQGLHYQIIEAHYAYPIGTHIYQYYDTVEDVSYISVGEPEAFRINPQFQVDIDTWHHLLVSFDFSNPVDVVAIQGDPATEEELRKQTIKSHCKLWYAFDDENKNGKDNLGDYDWNYGNLTGWVPDDENGLITRNAEDFVKTYSVPPPDLDSVGDPIRTGGGATPEYHWEASPLPMEGGPMGLPAITEFVETIYHCEMAEFQMWSGVTLDTEVTSNRRAFVDEEGKPVKPTGTDDDPAPAVRLLGKKPDVLLHGNSNWQAGKNTGTIGLGNIDGVPTIIPSGQFTPVARIEKYKPEPVLTETPTG